MRIISLCPPLTELVFDLGLGHELVGRTKFCIHPADRVDAVEKVGGTKNPKVDRIIELARADDDNADTFVSALLTDTGGRNVFATRSDRYPTITARSEEGRGRSS